MSKIDITLSREDLDLLMLSLRQSIQPSTDLDMEAKVRVFLKLARRRVAGDYTPSLYDPCLVPGEWSK